MMQNKLFSNKFYHIFQVESMYCSMLNILFNKKKNRIDFGVRLISKLKLAK